MIYACLRFLQEWHTPLTVINYTLFGGASGFLLASGLASIMAPEMTRFYAGWTLILVLLALVGRAASLLRNARLKPKSSMRTAIGVKHPRIVQKAQGAMGGSFNTREFFHGQSAALLRQVKWVFLILVFPLPVNLLRGGGEWGAPSLRRCGFACESLSREGGSFFPPPTHPRPCHTRQSPEWGEEEIRCARRGFDCPRWVAQEAPQKYISHS
ncbi:MAG: hypothetical protein M5R42_18520 [Rhodocyclaceae bacterium]|nr:hypothetical protein [Rhodocyclaceae bacterium]